MVVTYFQVHLNMTCNLVHSCPIVSVTSPIISTSMVMGNVLDDILRASTHGSKYMDPSGTTFVIYMLSGSCPSAQQSPWYRTSNLVLFMRHTHFANLQLGWTASVQVAGTPLLYALKGHTRRGLLRVLNKELWFRCSGKSKMLRLPSERDWNGGIVKLSKIWVGQSLEVFIRSTSRDSLWDLCSFKKRWSIFKRSCCTLS